MPTLAEAFVDIIGRDTGLAKAMGKAEKDVNSSTAKMQARLKAFGDGMKVIGAKMSLAVTAPIVAMAGVSVKAFAEEEDALNRLDAALTNTGSMAEGAMDRYRAFASEVQKATVYGDELIISTMAYGHNLGIQASQLEDAAKAAAGLAAKYKLDLNTAMMLLGRASQGNTMMLKRYGIQLDETLSPQEKFNQLLEIGAKNFGLAEAEARTTSGQLKQLKNQFGDLQEEIGAALAPSLLAFVEKLKSVVTWFQKLSDGQKKMLVYTAAVAALLGPVVVLFGQLALAISGVSLAVKGLSIAIQWLNTHPIVRLVSLIALAAVALFGLIKWLKTGKKDTDEFAKGMAGVDKAIADVEATIKRVSGNTLDVKTPDLKVDGGGDTATTDTGRGSTMTDLVDRTGQWIEEERERVRAWALDLVRTRKSAWEQVLSLSESFTVRMTELAQGETAAKLKAIDLETAKRREAIDKGVRDETRKAMLLKALDMDVAAQKQALTDEEARKANEQAKADTDAKRNRIGFAGSLGDVWRSAMTAGARLGVPDAPAVQTAKYSKEQVDLLKQIAEYTQGQLDLAKGNVNKLSAAEALL